MTMTAFSMVDGATATQTREPSQVRGRSAQEVLDARAVRHTFGPRQVIIRQGDPAQRVYLVDLGRVKSVMRSVEGSNSALEVLGPGLIFGEAALLDGEPVYTTTVTGMERGEMRSIDRADFLAWLDEYPRESLRLLSTMTSRVRLLSERVDISSVALPRRLARMLLLLLAEIGSPADAGAAREPLNVSQQDLGEFVGAARESVNRQLRSWEREGIVQLRRGRVVVTNPTALDDLSHKA